jgi:hypothetical protein
MSVFHLARKNTDDMHLCPGCKNSLRIIPAKFGSMRLSSFAGKNNMWKR